MSALMYDSDNETYPAGARYLACYVDGSRTGGNYARASAKRPGAKILTISAVGVADADVIDIEPGCVWPPEAAVPWLRRQLAAGRTPIYYCNTSTRQQCINAFYLAGLPELPWWRADYQSQYAINPPGSLTAGEIAWQYANPPITGNHWDVSLISDQLQAYLDGNPHALTAASSGATPITVGGVDIGGGLQEEDDMTPEQAAQLDAVFQRVTTLAPQQWIEMHDQVGVVWQKIATGLVNTDAQFTQIFDRVNYQFEQANPAILAALQQILVAVANLDVPAGSEASAGDILNKLGDALKAAAKES